ncbi:MAG: porin family protein [Rhizobiales bacterium]|nr:porin family protein [Hyphomicrobiales bacterium]
MKRNWIAGVAVALSTAGTAWAADMPVKAHSVSAVPPVTNWTGLYVGGHVGYGWGDEKNVATTGNTNFVAGHVFDPTDVNGIIGGGQFGANFQAGSWVFGLEGEYSASGIDGRRAELTELNPQPNLPRTSTSHPEVDWLADVTGRVGYSWGNWLVYAKGGGAWTHTKGSSVVSNAVNAALATTVGSENRSGWLVGGGVEWVLSQNWSAKIEYNYMDFGTKGISRTNITPGPNLGNVNLRDSSLTLNTIKFGVNYRFNWGAM